MKCNNCPLKKSCEFYYEGRKEPSFYCEYSGDKPIIDKIKSAMNEINERNFKRLKGVHSKTDDFELHDCANCGNRGKCPMIKYSWYVRNSLCLFLRNPDCMPKIIKIDPAFTALARDAAANLN